MPPDLNTLPTSRPPSMPGLPITARPRRISLSTQEAVGPSSPSPRSPPLSSLQAAAAINAGLHHSPSRRRSSLMNSLILNDPVVLAPGNLQHSSNGSEGSGGSPRLARRSFALHTADPHHHRHPSLGELHQELENEQEAQVNRLLQMIRIQQDQLAAVHRQQPSSADSAATSSEQSPATRITPASAATTEASSTAHSSSASLPAAGYQHFNRPHSLSRRSSALVSNPDSRGSSPALRPQSASLGPLAEDFLLGGTRDDSTFYQAETQMLTRENQMLKLRIKELEHEIASLGGASVGPVNQAHQRYPLVGPPTTCVSDNTPTATASVESMSKAD